MRVFDLLCASVLLVLAGLKIWDGSWLENGLAATAITTVEGAIGLSFLIGRTPRLSGACTMVLGLGFSISTLAGGVAGVAGPACGCLGLLVPTFAEHLAISLAVLSLGSLRLLFSPAAPSGTPVLPEKAVRRRRLRYSRSR